MIISDSNICKTCQYNVTSFVSRLAKETKTHWLSRAFTVKTGQAMHYASNQPCILVHRCHFRLPPPIQISQLGPVKKKTERRFSVNKKQCRYIFFKFFYKQHCPVWASCCAPCQMHLEQRKTRHWQHLAMAQRSFSILQLQQEATLESGFKLANASPSEGRVFYRATWNKS